MAHKALQKGYVLYFKLIDFDQGDESIPLEL